MAGIFGGGFLGRVADSLGQNIIEGQKFESRDLDNQLKQQQVALTQMSMLQQQQKMDTQKRIGQMMASTAATDKAAIDNPAEAAKLYGKASTMAMQSGDFDTATQMSALAQGKIREAQAQASEQLQQKQQDREALASAAFDFDTAPTQENAQSVAKAAMKAGMPIQTIPQAGTPEFKTWAKQQQLAAMNGKEKMQFVEKQQEFAQKREDRKAEFEARQQDRQEARSDRAAYRQGILALREASIADRQERQKPQIIELNGKKYQFDPNGELTGDRLESNKKYSLLGEARPSDGGPIQQRRIVEAVNPAHEAMRTLTLMGETAPGTSAGVFSELKSGGDVLGALQRVGANKLTPQDQQIFQTAAKGLSLELAQLAVAGTGRGANNTQIHEFNEMVRINPGDTQYTALFKISNAVDFIKTRMEAVPESKDAKILALQRKTDEEVKKWPTPSQILQQARKNGVNLNDLATRQATSYATALQRTKDLAEEDARAATGTKPPADIQNLINKYAPK